MSYNTQSIRDLLLAYEAEADIRNHFTIDNMKVHRSKILATIPEDEILEEDVLPTYEAALGENVPEDTEITVYEIDDDLDDDDDDFGEAYTATIEIGNGQKLQKSKANAVIRSTEVEDSKPAKRRAIAWFLTRRKSS